MDIRTSKITVLLPGLALMFIIGAGTVRAEAPDGKVILDGLNVSPGQVEALEGGDVLTLSGEPWEQTKRELAADAVVIIKRPLQDVLRETLDEASLIPKHKILAFGEILSEDDFASFTLTEQDLNEVEKILESDPKKNLNLSKDEIASIKALKKENPKYKSSDEVRIAIASEALRNILTTRYLAYQASGLAGIAPYAKPNFKTVDIGHELRLTTQTHQPIEEFFPAYYATLLDYPEGADCCKHSFYWIKIKIQRRPTFALVHRITLIGDDYALITERYYYASHSLNSLQVVVGWLPYGDGTYMGLATSASADILSGLTGKFLRAIGRGKANELVGEVLQDIKSDLEATPVDGTGE